MKEKNKNLLETIKCIVIGIIVGLLLRLLLFNNIYIVSGTSMNPTLNDKQTIKVSKVKEDTILNRFDVVVVKTGNGLHKKIIKRVVALPGETISADEYGRIFVNGEELTNLYSYQLGIINEGFSEILLSDNEYFVLGDNINNSLDSRFYGPFIKSKIISKCKDL